MPHLQAAGSDGFGASKLCMRATSALQPYSCASILYFGCPNYIFLEASVEVVACGAAQEKDDKIADLKRKLLAVKPKQFAMAGAGGMSLEDSVMAGICAPPRPAPLCVCSPPALARGVVQISWPIHHAPAQQLPEYTNMQLLPLGDNMMLKSIGRQDGMTSIAAHNVRGAGSTE